MQAEYVEYKLYLSLNIVIYEMPPVLNQSFPLIAVTPSPTKRQKNYTESAVKQLRDTTPPFNGEKFSRKLKT
jgi:hypothetical protein